MSDFFFIEGMSFTGFQVEGDKVKCTVTAKIDTKMIDDYAKQIAPHCAMLKNTDCGDVLFISEPSNIQLTRYIKK